MCNYTDGRYPKSSLGAARNGCTSEIGVAVTVGEQLTLTAKLPIVLGGGENAETGRRRIVLGLIPACPVTEELGAVCDDIVSDLELPAASYF